MCSGRGGWGEGSKCWIFSSPHTSMRKKKASEIVFVCGKKRKKIFVCAYIFHIFLYMKATRKARRTIYKSKKWGFINHWRFKIDCKILSKVRNIYWKFIWTQKYFDELQNQFTVPSSLPLFHISLSPHTSLSRLFLFSHSHPIKKRNKNAKKEIENG